jgi:hypothetical protein
MSYFLLGFESSSSPAHGKLCYSLGGLPPRMAQYRVLASEGRQRYSVYTKKNLNIYRKNIFFFKIYNIQHNC